eukprot:4854319-Alexandrium_andersonii.AAC.1
MQHVIPGLTASVLKSQAERQGRDTKTVWEGTHPSSGHRTRCLNQSSGCVCVSACVQACVRACMHANVRA